MASRNNTRLTTPRAKSRPQISHRAKKSKNSSSLYTMGQTPQNQAGQYSRSNPQYSKASAKRMGKGPKIAIAALCVVVLLFAGGGTAFAMYMNSINETLKGDKTEEEQQAIADTLAPVHNYTEPFYMLLIGSDAREGSEEEGQRSDTNILVRVDPTNCVVTMLSIPRDTKITIDGYGTNKFNAAYQYGGAASTIKEANQLCGVEISHYAEINFESMIKLVDVIGGVEVDVPELVDDPDAGPVVVQPGLQTLNGEAALTFARSRAYADGDFTRTSNQRLLIEALVTKVLSMPLTDLPGVIQEAAKCVTTDLSVNQIIDLASQFKDIGQLTVYSGMVPSSTTMISGISYVIADTVKLAEVMAAIDLGQDPSLVWNSEMGYSSSSATEESTSTYSGGSTYYEEPYDSGYYDSGSYDSGGYDSGYYEEDYSGSYDDSYSTEYVEDYAA